MNQSAITTLFLMAGLSVLAGATTSCSKKAPVVVPTAAPSSTTNPTPVPQAGPIVQADEPEAARPRPSVLVFVEGGPDDKTIWRGWPVLVHAAILQGDGKAELTVSGPSTIAPERRGRIWVIPPATSKQLMPGTYTFAVGAGSTEVVLSDPPSAPTPQHLAILRRLSAHADLALGNTDAALRTSREWIAAEPKSVEARTVLGDALRAAGDRKGAAAAYDEAIRLVPPGIRPPGSLHARAAELLREEIDALPATPARPPNPDETEFFQLIDAGARALASGNRAEAARCLAAADALHRDRRLVLSRHELEQLQAALGALPDDSTPTPPVTPQRPDDPVVPSKAAPGVVLAAELADEKIRADAAGQWAATAIAGSQYGKTQYSAAKATGAPDVPTVGNSPDAWCPAGKDSGTDWLEVTFATPVHATEIRVRQNDAAGAITKIEAIEPDGTLHVWWEGVDPLVAKAARDIAWFAVRVPKTPYLVAKAKITLNLAAVPGWKEIDAVQVVGAPR